MVPWLLVSSFSFPLLCFCYFKWFNASKTICFGIAIPWKTIGVIVYKSPSLDDSAIVIPFHNEHDDDDDDEGETKLGKKLKSTIGSNDDKCLLKLDWKNDMTAFLEKKLINMTSNPKSWLCDWKSFLIGYGQGRGQSGIVINYSGRGPGFDLGIDGVDWTQWFSSSIFENPHIEFWTFISFCLSY